MSNIMRLLKNEQGLETVEYAVLTALIIGGVMIALTALVTAISNRFDSTSDTITNP